MRMHDLTQGRFAVFAIGDGGEIAAERFFADATAAYRALDDIAATCARAHRIVLIDRRDGRRLAERAGQAV